jgi:hypothetical protein
VRFGTTLWSAASRFVSSYYLIMKRLGRLLVFSVPEDDPVEFQVGLLPFQFLQKGHHIRIPKNFQLPLFWVGHLPLALGVLDTSSCTVTTVHSLCCHWPIVYFFGGFLKGMTTIQLDICRGYTQHT